MPIFDDRKKLTEYLNSSSSPFNRPVRVLMVRPDHFDIRYAINPHMVSAGGDLQKVDKALAEKQWKELLSTYHELGLEVEVLSSDPSLPDMVFAANHALVWQSSIESKPNVLMGRMRSKFREPEIPLFEAWYKKNGYTVHTLQGQGGFEGNGDALLYPREGLVIGGFGPRTDEWIYEEISERFSLNILRLELTTDSFYHLDTCFSILNDTTAVLCPTAIEKSGREALYELFENVIEIPEAEAKRYFTANCHSPDGKHVLSQSGDSEFFRKLESLGLKSIPLDTSEFIKAGGSVFCLKMMVY